VLIRHGEANAAVRRIVGGHQGCTGLSPKGRAQAEALAQRLTRTGELVGTDVLATSVLPRAQETAEAIASALGGVAIDNDCDLCELHPGEADGLGWDEADRLFGPSQPFDPDRPVAPGGESWFDMARRHRGGVGRLVGEHPGQTIVVACHGGVIDSSFFLMLGVGPLGLAPENTSITEWLAADDGWHLRRFNDHAHLLGLI
jgi:probable phosphoglycerate mutase